MSKPRIGTFYRAFVALYFAATSANAGEPPTGTPARSWYGYQTLAADGGAIAGGMATGGVLFLPAYLLEAPVVHAIHGRPIRGLLDLGLRLGLPIAGAFAVGGGDYLVTRAKGPSLLAFGAVGAASGAIAAVSIDAGVLAWDEPQVRKSAVSISPSVRFFGKEKTLGLVGMW